MSNKFFSVTEEQLDSAIGAVKDYFKGQRSQMREAVRARAAYGLSEAEHQVVEQVLRFDNTYMYSDDNSMWRRGLEQEKEIIELVSKGKENGIRPELCEEIMDAIRFGDKHLAFYRKYIHAGNMGLEEELKELEDMYRRIMDAMDRCLKAKRRKFLRVCNELGGYFERYGVEHPINDSRNNLIERHYRKTPGYSALGIPKTLSDSLLLLNNDRKFVKDWLTLTLNDPGSQHYKYRHKNQYHLVRLLRKHIPTTQLVDFYGGSLAFLPHSGVSCHKYVAVSTKYYGVPKSEADSWIIS